MMSKRITRLPDSTSPGQVLRAVVPNDTDDLPLAPCRALYVGADGDVTVVAMQDDTPVMFKAVAAGTILPVACRAVRAGADIVAIY